MKEKTGTKLRIYIIAIAIPLAVGLASALLTKENMNIYNEIITPPAAPPSWVFPIAWTVLYILMGISSGMVYINREISNKNARTGLIFYGVSLFFNLFWSVIFFNMRAFGFAFVWLALLLYFIVKTLICYKRVKPAAAYLQIPYVLWVAFAGYLNMAIFILNR